MSWDQVKDTKQWVLRQAAMYNPLPMCSVPQHVALIMDGNRRWARQHKLRASDGHREGFGTLERMMQAANRIGIRHLTVYAFSIENFKRDQEEIDAIMDLVVTKFRDLSAEDGTAKRLGVRIRILGDLSRVESSEVRAALQEAELRTAGNGQCTLNVCFSYTARQEMAQGLSSVVRGIANGTLDPTDLSPEVLELALYSAGSPPVDLLIRTSGEVRLSDFMLWQCSDALLSFVPHMWPDLREEDLINAVLWYQQQQLMTALAGWWRVPFWSQAPDAGPHSAGSAPWRDNEGFATRGSGDRAIDESKFRAFREWQEAYVSQKDRFRLDAVDQRQEEDGMDSDRDDIFSDVDQGPELVGALDI
eukprot:Clim_evm28s108 gene=Clim_evmTU28s108